MKKAIIFDLDGTLIDTARDIHATLNECLAAYKLPKITYESCVQFIGDGAKKLVERAIGDNEEYYESVYNLYSVRFAECGNKLTCLYEGESEFLKMAKSAGIKLAILTNKPQKATDNAYNQFLSSFNFDCVLGMSDKFPLKPNPESVLEVIRRLGVKKEDCLFVGDGETDVLTAKNAGIEGVSVLWGYRTKEQLASVGAKNFAKNYAELQDLVFKQ